MSVQDGVPIWGSGARAPAGVRGGSPGGKKILAILKSKSVKFILKILPFTVSSPYTYEDWRRAPAKAKLQLVRSQSPLAQKHPFGEKWKTAKTTGR